MKAFTLSTLATALTLVATTAYAGPTISGRLYLGGLYQDKETHTTNTVTGVKSTEKSDRATMETSGSRIRVKGEEALTPNTDLEYHLEYALQIDNDDTTKNFTSRNTYLGLKNKQLGTVRAGRIFTPDDDIDYVDQSFNYADGTGLPFSYGGQRTNNTIQYISPKFNNGKTQFKLHYAMDEDVSGKTDGTNNHGGKATIFDKGVASEKRRDLVSGYVLHEDEKFDAGASYTQAGDFNAVRAMVSLKPSEALTVGVIAQQTDYNSDKKELGGLVSAYYKINGNTDVYAQAGHSKNYEGYKDADRTVGSIGLIKWLKRDGGSTLRTYGSVSYNDQTSFERDDNTKELLRKESEALGIEAGVRYDF